MASPLPAVRVCSVTSVLNQVELSHLGMRRIIEALLPAETRALLLTRGPLEWLPVEYDHHVAERIYEQLGDADADACFRASMLSNLRGPVLGGMMRGTLELLKPEPSTFAWMLSSGWPLVCRGFGEPRLLNVQDTTMHVSIDNVHGRVFDFPVYWRFLPLMLEAYFGLCRPGGQLEHQVIPARGRIELCYRWDTAARPVEVRRVLAVGSSAQAAAASV